MNKRNSDLNLIFSTPLWTTVVPNYKEINTKFSNYIQNLQTNDPEGRKKSNLIGWHSKNFNLSDPVPQFFIKNISSILNESINDMGWDIEKNELKITGMWSIINPSNASNARHIHSNNYISAAYYVKAPKNCGDIKFHDPRSAKVIRTPITKKPNNLNLEVINITPQEGLLVLFPSYLHHSVDMNNSSDERVVISFNIDLI
tara:strand:- start:11017 stop:11619 length:603 start_codon:yes stop_codon:yes gene_type:complete